MENGGRLLAAATWGGRQCQQACGATAREVRSADKLICTEGTDAVVWGYPADRENEVRRLRGEAKRGAAAGWRPPANPLKVPQGIPQGTEQALPVDMPKGNAELERNGIRKELNPPTPLTAAALVDAEMDANIKAMRNLVLEVERFSSASNALAALTRALAGVERQAGRQSLPRGT